MNYEEIRQREVARINEERKQEALMKYHAILKYNIKHKKSDVITIPQYEEMK